ncbi:phosphoethanolamine transferase [Psittacicella hinzii]|uniref:Sulfatase N-terminal domain-containing protein n=1 Tax=Psittacicella hinzii TaxID=2028575 RepID=A0A3A1YSB7_9GAMM|nr:phosphoethanolamine transferase [Psittacicella hinzii]RIY38917.1 hypothetical protein CKF58_03145 [Psittacicella hinzii]
MKFLRKLWDLKFYFVLFIFVVLNHIALGYTFTPLEVLASYVLIVLLYRYIPFLFYAVILIYGLVGGCYLPQAIIYGPVQSGIIASLFETNSVEAKEYLSTIPFWIYAVSVLFVLFSWVVAYYGKKRKAYIRRYHSYRRRPMTRYPVTPGRAIAVSLAVLFVIIGCIYKPYKLAGSHFYQQMAFSRVYPLFYFVKIYRDYQQYFIQKDALTKDINKQSSWQITSVEPKYKTYVVIIGESARQDYFSVYGKFDLNTTPFLEQTPSKIYNGYIAAASNTYMSIFYTMYQHLADKTVYENNIVSLAKQAGFNTAWLSSQGYLGEYDTIASRLGVQADSSYFPTHGVFDLSNAKDKDLLPLLENTLQTASDKPRVVFLHMIGSHPSFCHRLWENVNYDYLNKNMSCYVQSIKQTDDFIAAVVDIVKKQSPSYSVMYFSDHGLTYPNSQTGSFANLTIGQNFQENYRVPFVVLSSDDTEHQVINFQQSATNFIQGFAEWTGIKLANYANAPSFFLGTNQPIKVFNQFSWVNFADLPVQPIIAAPEK